MTLVLVDDSVPYDGNTPRTRPLGGVERAVVSLAEAIASRGRKVTAYTRCFMAVTVRGVQWEPIPPTWGDDDGAGGNGDVDTVLALRDPSLLAVAPGAKRRLLWALAPGDYLLDPPFSLALQQFRPKIIVPGEVARFACPFDDVSLIRPGLDDFCIPRTSDLDVPAPVALTTTHPAHGLGDVLAVWRDIIHPQVPGAKLHVYSSLLQDAVHGGAVERSLADLAETALDLSTRGVEVKAPLPAPAMAEVYRSARVHLYPGHPHDLVCWTLAESQACGLPAVALMRGACGEALVNGDSGYLVPDFEALGNLGVQILREDALWRSLHAGARNARRRASWDVTSRCFDQGPG